MFDKIQEIIEAKEATRPLLVKVWKDLVEHLSPLDIKSTILRYYYIEFGDYTNIGILTPRLIIDLETNDKIQIYRFSVTALKAIGGAVLSNVPDDLEDSSNKVAFGETRNPTLVGMLLTTEQDVFITWYSTREEEEELRAFIRTISGTLFSQ